MQQLSTISIDTYVENEHVVIERLKNDLYVDDLVSGSDTLEEAKGLYDRSKVIMSEAGFDIRKWETNHKELRAYITSQNVSRTHYRKDQNYFSNFVQRQTKLG